MGWLLLVVGVVGGAWFLWKAEAVPFAQRLIIVAGVIGGGWSMWRGIPVAWAALTKLLGA